MAAANQLLGGKYRLERLLGSGGFASVWEARHEQLGRPVAIKVLSDNLALRPDFVERFLREARLASRPLHETICRVEDLGTTDDEVPYLVMELLVGTSLSDELKARGALPFEEAAEIGRLALQGLAAAHAQGIVHRDIKPANMFLCNADMPGPPLRILDFGLAKDLGEAEGFTTTEQFMGTPDFFPPEYFVGEWREYGPEGDVFALGIVLFSALTGRRPLDGILSRGTRRTAFYERASFYSTNERLPSPAEVAPDVPPELDAVVARAIAIDPEHRYADAGEMLGVWEQAVLSLQSAGLLPVLDPAASHPPAALLSPSAAPSGGAEPSRSVAPSRRSPSYGDTGGSGYGPFVADAPAKPRRRLRVLWFVAPAVLSVVLVVLLAYHLLVTPGAGPEPTLEPGVLPAGQVGGVGGSQPEESEAPPGSDGEAEPAGVMDFTAGAGADEEPDGSAVVEAGDAAPADRPPRRIRRVGRTKGPGRPRGRGKRPPRGGGGDDYGAVPFDQMGRGN